jgi:hypothetical protein
MSLVSLQHGKLYQFLVDHGFYPLLQRLDNEAMAKFQRGLHSKQINYQLAPPSMHCCNPAERAIQTFKNHFVATLCTTDPTFLMHQWDALLPQATLTLNLLQSSRLNPQLSAYKHLQGTFYFNRTPLAPPGCKVIIHK